MIALLWDMEDNILMYLLSCIELESLGFLCDLLPYYQRGLIFIVAVHTVHIGDIYIVARSVF